jgi:protein SCO1/2
MNRGRIFYALLAAFSCACDGGVGTRLDSSNAPPTDIARASAPATASTEIAAAVTSPSAPARREAATPLGAPSIYDLPVVLHDQDGNEVSIDVLRGHPVLITLFYASCPMACPLLTTDLKRIDDRVSPAARARLRVLMVSFDARHDTPALLSRYAKDRSLDLTRWKLANAADDSARDLAAALGVRYRKLENGAFYHTSVIVLLDEEGRPKARVEGLGQDPAPILAAL